MATNNANKLREVREILSPLGIEVLSQREAGADCDPDENGEALMEGACEGVIGFREAGENGFGYDPVFMVGDRTMAELSAEEKNEISHRGAALRELYRFLKERYGE